MRGKRIDGREIGVEVSVSVISGNDRVREAPSS